MEIALMLTPNRMSDHASNQSAGCQIYWKGNCKVEVEVYAKLRGR